MNQFSELALSPNTKNNLARAGFVTPTPVQAQAIPPALEGRDLIATAQTGTGKTLAFALPIVEKLATLSNTQRNKGIQAVILSPTRELALQIQETFQKLIPGTNLRTAVVVGGMSEGNQLRAIRGGAQIVIATPGRLCDFLQRKLVSLATTRILVLDEADRMLDMGFLPSLKQILQNVPAERQTLFFSATMEKSVAHLVESHVKNPVRVAIGSVTKPTEQVDLHLYEVEQHQKLGLLEHLLRVEQGTFLVFVKTKHGADRLSDKLQRDGVKAARIHGNRTQNQRNQALAAFKNGDCRVLVATDVAARGIHVDGIGHVVNFDLPQVAEDFVHRIGRTGRAGERGSAATFAMRSERRDIREIEKTLGVKLSSRPVAPELLTEAPAKSAFAAPQADNPRAAKVVVIPSRQASHKQAAHKQPTGKQGGNANSGWPHTGKPSSGKSASKKTGGYYTKFAKRSSGR